MAKCHRFFMLIDAFGFMRAESVDFLLLGI